jgi:Kef-type K+ transport system membrane component KefB
VLAIVGKLVGCGAAAVGLGWRRVTIIGVGMAPRGEVGLIVANVGAALAIIPNSMYSTVVIMSVLTTLVVPPVLTLLYGGQGKEPVQVDDYAVADGRLPDL